MLQTLPKLLLPAPKHQHCDVRTCNLVPCNTDLALGICCTGLESLRGVHSVSGPVGSSVS